MNFITKYIQHLRYIKLQRDRSKSKYAESFANAEEKLRKEYMNKLIFTYATGQRESALIIGCRNAYELDLMEAKGVKSVKGIDLFSYDKRVQVMDMHHLKFPDNSFDILLSSHSLEHAEDYEQVMAEIIRVVKNDAIVAIEVPVNYQTRGSDIHDYQNSGKLMESFAKFGKVTTLFTSDLKVGAEGNFNATDISRVIFKVSK